MSKLSGRMIAVVVAAAIGVAASAAAGEGKSPFELSVLGSYSTGLGAGAAEIVSYDKQSRRLFTINAAASSVDILSVADPTTPTLVKRLDLSALGSPNSVAAHDGVMAVAIQAPVKTDQGVVGFYTIDGELLGTIAVGSLPDMLTFTPDGRHVLVANEGEPSGYGRATDVDPEGSVTIIEVPKTRREWKQLGPDYVKTVDFKQFNGQEAALRAQGIRIYGPGASAAQDFEPEYIAVATDSELAYVTLQENNAIAEIDVEEGTLTKLMPLGYKDYRAKPAVAATYEWDDLPSIGRTAAGQELTLGGFSGLAFEGRTRDGKLQFVTTTDRGPNAEPTGIMRPFLLPEYAPRIVRFTLDPSDGRFELLQQIQFKDSNGRKLTGLPNTGLSGDASQPYNDEVPVDLFGNVIPLDPLGGDFECIVVADDGSFWLGDEYRPAIYHFDRKGVLLQRYVPFGTHAAAGKAVPAAGTAGELGIEALPAVIAQRRQNRGIEALAQQNGKLYAFVQSPIRNPASLANGALNAMKNVRVVEFDPGTLATRQFLYEMDNPAPLNTADTRADKIGDATAARSGEFLVIERDDDSAANTPVEAITKKVYSFTLGNATDITSVDAIYPVVRNGTTVNLSLDQMTATELAGIGVRGITKSPYVDLAQAGYASVQKIEGLTMLDDGRLALINDNDFGVAQIVVDNATGTFTRVPTYSPEKETLGLIDVPGLDASDRDAKVNIRDWPVFGMYEPDAIAAYDDVKGRTFLVTANEGDARDWPGYSEESRVGSLSLDATAFPNAATLKSNANLGRLNVTTSMGDIDGDKDYDALFTLGGRSFSIWSSTGEQVFDSGSQFERITAYANAAHFNASNDNDNFDDRSDNKGPEPEGVAVGKIDDRTYAFIGLERTGGLMMYDVTDPAAPFFVDYLNNRNFAGGGDRGPEGVHFISAKESPNGQPMVAVANEISGTVTLYAVKKK